MNRRRSAILLVASALAVVGGALTFRLRAPPIVVAADSAVEMFYRQTLADSAGTMRSMADHRGRVVVVNFWATWCVPCVQEIPAFSKANTDAGGRVDFVGLGIDGPENIANFAARVKPSYPLLPAGASGTDLARAFGDASGALPFTVVLGVDGRVIGSHLGRVDDATLEAWIAPHRDGSVKPVRADAAS